MGGSRSPHAARGILLEVNQRKSDYFELKHHQPVLVTVPSGQNVFHHVTPVSFALSHSRNHSEISLTFLAGLHTYIYVPGLVLTRSLGNHSFPLLSGGAFPRQCRLEVNLKSGCKLPRMRIFELSPYGKQRKRVTMFRKISLKLFHQ